MVRHIVVWKLGDMAHSLEIKTKLLALNGQIEVLKSIEVGIRSPQAPSSCWDVVLDTTFDTFADLDAYRVHPEHVKVGEYVQQIALQRVAIDYEY